MAALKILHVYLKILGICPYYLATDGNIRLSYGRVIYAVILSVIYSALYVRAVTNRMTYVITWKTPITQIVNAAGLTFEGITLIVAWLYFGLRPRRLQRILVLHENINVAFKAHDVRTDDERLFSEMKIHMILVNLFWYMYSFYCFALFRRFEASEIEKWMPLIILRLVNHNVVFLFVNIVKSIGRRFRLLNEKMMKRGNENCTRFEIRPKIGFGTIAVAKNCGIESSRFLNPPEAYGQIHTDLVELTTIVVQYFSLTILFTILFQCIQTASSLYAICIVSTDVELQHWILAWTAWLVLHFGELAIIMSVCHSTVHEANQTGNALHTAMITGQMVKYLETASMVSLRFLQERLKIELFGLFSMDLVIIYKVVGMVTAYVTVMMQLDDRTA